MYSQNGGKALHEEYLEVLKQNKRICFSGNIGTAKFQRSIKLALELTNGNEANIEVIAFNPNIIYEDFIFGTSIETNGNELAFLEQQKRLLTILDRAHETKEPFVLILKDLNKVNVYEVFGDAIGLIKGDERLPLNCGIEKAIPSNLHIIATYNPLYTAANSHTSDMQSLFYTIELSATDGALDRQDEQTVPEAFLALQSGHQNVNYSTAYAQYARVNQLIRTYLLPEYEQDNYFLIGPYYFLDPNSVEKIKYQLVPLLEEYVKNGVLAKNASIEIAALVKTDHYVSEYSQVPDYHVVDFTDNSRNPNKKNASDTKISKQPFTDYIERLWTDAPLGSYTNPETPHYLICQLLDLRLISVKELMQEIIYTPTFYQYQRDKTHGYYLYTNLNNKIPEYEKVSKDKKVTYQPLYRNKSGVIRVNGIDYGCFKSHAYYNYAIKDFNSNILDQDYVHTNYINPLIFAILKRFYERYLHNLAQLNDANSKLLKDYIEQQWQQFEQTVKGFATQKFTKKYNEKNIDDCRQSFYFQFLKAIDKQLPLLKMTIGDEITLENGETITLKGAYSVEENNYFETMQQLNIHQMILQGPPGTSKTHSTNELLKSRIQQLKGIEDVEALNLALRESQFNDVAATYSNGIAWSIVQFHPSYTYEDFIRGIRVETSNGQPSYETVNKILGEMAQQAIDNPNIEYYLIVDEINRANLATVFGELIYGLEYRGNKVGTPYKVDKDYTIELPENLYIIGTMNTADKSVGSIDYAIRRRFLFFDLLPNVNVIENETKNSIDADKPSPAVKLFNALSKLFQNHTSKDYRQSDVQIGHTYFLTEKLVKKEIQTKLQPQQIEPTAENVHELRKQILKSRFQYQIVPILREYLKDGILVDSKQQSADHHPAIDALFKLLKYDAAYTVDEVFTALLEEQEQQGDAE